LELMRMPLDKVRALGERMQELGHRLTRDTEPTSVLRDDLKNLNKDLVRCWNESARVQDLLPASLAP
jgi:hypothetical protein